MKKRILGLLLALCMIVGLLPVVAMAAPSELTVSISKGQVAWTVAAGEVYYASVSGATATDHGKTEPSAWNIKVDNTQDEAVITLKSIEFYHRGWLIDVNSTGDIKIVVENDCKVDYLLRAITTNTTGTTTITGPGKLECSSFETAVYHGIQATTGNLVVDNANIKVFNTPADNRAGDMSACLSAGGDLTIKNSTLELIGEANCKGIVAVGKLTVEGGSNVDVKIDHPYEHCIKADSIAIKNSNLKAAVLGESGPTIIHYAINKMPALEGVTAQYGPDLETLTDLTLEAGADTTALEDAVFVIFTATSGDSTGGDTTGGGTTTGGTTTGGTTTGGTTTGGSTSNNPQTGDNTALVLCFFVMLASAAALIFTKKRIAA